MSVLESVPVGLIADIGGTNARFALCRPGQEAYEEYSLPCADFPGPVEAAETYLKIVRLAVRPKIGAFAVASPILGDKVIMTNHPWHFSIERIRQALGLRSLAVINDFAAVALCVPHLLPSNRLKVGGGTSTADAPIGVLGAGTGLGVALLVPDGTHWRVIPTEGGHVTMPAADEDESAVLHVLRRRFGHVSAERTLSGPGLVNLYLALSEIAGHPPESVEPTTVTERGLMGTDPLCLAAVRMFLAMLGTIAGNLVLTTGGRGGLYIAGGIVPRLTTLLPTSLFRSRFENKGRFRHYNMAIPTYVITHSYPAFLGLSSLLYQSLEQLPAEC